LKIMFPLRCFFIASLVSLGFGALLLLWALLVPPAGTGEWAVVYAAEGMQDREIGEKLKALGLEYVGESSQWVLLDDFSALKQVPLDSYEEQLESFDPRNDGYAQRLRAFFVQNGERRIFIEKKGMGASALEKTLRKILGPSALWRADLNPGGLSRKDLALTMALFAAASVLCIVFVGTDSLFALLCTLPVLAFLALAGPVGLAAAGILEAVFCLLREPLAERFRSTQGASRIVHNSLVKELSGWFHTFPRELGGSLVGIVLYGVICVVGKIPLVVSLPVICFLVPVLLLPPWAESRVVRNLFFPLPIRKGQFLLLFPPPLPVFMLAFAGALVFSVFQGHFLPGEAPAASVSVSTITVWPQPPEQEEYERHGAFQASFSHRSLSNPAALYGSYPMGADGLIAGFVEAAPEKPIPPYPAVLNRLRQELGGESKASLPLGRFILLLILMLILSVPSLLGMAGYSKKKKTML
jgi:hypothetical protein